MARPAMAGSTSYLMTMRTPLDAGDQGQEKFDTSSKSPAHIQHRKKFGARAGKRLRAF
jgi:hypothetical protein